MPPFAANAHIRGSSALRNRSRRRGVLMKIRRRGNEFESATWGQSFAGGADFHCDDYGDMENDEVNPPGEHEKADFGRHFKYNSFNLLANKNKTKDEILYDLSNGFGCLPSFNTKACDHCNFVSGKLFKSRSPLTEVTGSDVED